MGRFCLLALTFLSLANLPLYSSPSVALVVEDAVKPEGFDLIGVYLVKSMVRVRKGKSTTIPLPDTRYRVYSNGQEIRLYQSEVADAYHSYQIYRADGISQQDTQGNISIKPGIQASHSTNHTVKQLSVTQARLTITQFPPISDTVVITYAKRLALGQVKR